MKFCDDCKRFLEGIHAICDEKEKCKMILFHGKNMNNGFYSCWQKDDDKKNNCVRTHIEQLAKDDEENNPKEKTCCD